MEHRPQSFVKVMYFKKKVMTEFLFMIFFHPLRSYPCLTSTPFYSWNSINRINNKYTNMHRVYTR